MTARELFYAAVQTQPAPSARPANRPKRPPATAAATAAIPPAASHTTVAVTVPSNPLGLKYSLLRRVSGKMVEETADAVFHAGDAIQLTVQTNASGYLYIVNKGSSGTWRPLFPAAEIANGDNHVEAWRTYTLPPEHPMVFDEQTGTENLTILFARHPVRDIEDLIYSLQGRPAEDPEEHPAPKTMVAEAHVNIDDATVGRLRETSTRDLVIEKVDAATPPDAGSAPGAQKETAVYVVNPAGAGDSRLAADLHLVHR